MHTRFARRLTLTFLATAPLLLTACSGTHNAQSTSDKAAPDTAAKAEPPSHITPAQAKAALVEAADLPAGWKLRRKSSAEQQNGKEHQALKKVGARCAPLAAVVNSGRLEGDYAAHARQLFVKKDGEEATSLGQDVSGYPRDRAERAMHRLRTAVEQCSDFKGTLEGRPATLTVQRTSIPRYGDDSLAYTVGVTVDGYEMDFDLATVRSHGAITSLVHNYPAGGHRGRKAFARALARAAAKLTENAAQTA